MDIRLPKLPDRTPVKLTISVPAELHQSLKDYAELYRAAYDAEEPVQDLIPYMLDVFLQSDRAFAKTGKGRTS